MLTITLFYIILRVRNFNENLRIDVNKNIIYILYLVESPFLHIFQEQITDLILVYNRDINTRVTNPNIKYVYEYAPKSFKNLKHLSIIGCVQLLSMDHLASTTWLSLNFYKLCIHVCGFEVCLALLDGRLKQLTTFIVKIGWTDDDLSTIYNMVRSYINR